MIVNGLYSSSPVYSHFTIRPPLTTCCMCLGFNTYSSSGTPHAYFPNHQNASPSRFHHDAVCFHKSNLLMEGFGQLNSRAVLLSSTTFPFLIMSKTALPM